MAKSELCTTNGENTKNTGHSGNECLESVLKRTMVAKTAFRFDTVADFKDKAKWILAVANKDIVPLFDAYAVAAANVAQKKFESGNFSIVTEDAIKKTKYESYLGFCSHAALASYEESEYTQVFEFNKDGSLIGVFDTDGIKVKGQDLTNLSVGIRNIATDAKPPFSEVEMTYRDFKELQNNFCVVVPDWSDKDVQGIFDVLLTQVARTTTSIKVGVKLECSGTDVTNFVRANFIVRNAAGAVQSVTFVPYDAVNKCYEFTGTGFATDFTVELNGVVTVGTTNYELVETLKLT